MSKQTGLGDNLYVAGVDLSGDIGSLGSISTPRGVTEVTGIDKSAFERLLTHKDGLLDYQAWFNPAAAQSHATLKALPTADEILTYCRGTALGSPAAMMVAKQLNYDGTRGNDGSLSFAVQAQANSFGLEWGRQLTLGKRADVAATNGDGLDQVTVSTAFGWQAYLHVFGVTGTSVTVTLEDSANGSAWAPLAGGAFTAAAGLTSQRLAGGATDTVRRHVRAVSSGVFTAASFAVSFVRNEAAVTF